MTGPNIHPGEILAEEFLKPAGVSADDLAAHLAIPRERIDGILAGQRAVCADTALRLSCYFGTSDRFWLEMQLRYDLERARRQAPHLAAGVRSHLAPAWVGRA